MEMSGQPVNIEMDPKIKQTHDHFYDPWTELGRTIVDQIQRDEAERKKKELHERYERAQRVLDV